MTHAAPAANPNLPADVAALRALVLATMAERDGAVAERNEAAAERDTLATQNDRLRHLLVKLQCLQFGRKSERLPEAQLQLGLEDLEAAIAQGDAKAEQRDPDLRRERTAKRRANHGVLPAHLPRIEVMLGPRDTGCPCCQRAMVVIGKERSERLDMIPAQVRVLVMRRPKLACRACRACAGVVVQTPAPPQLIAGGLPTEALFRRASSCTRTPGCSGSATMRARNAASCARRRSPTISTAPPKVHLWQPLWLPHPAMSLRFRPCHEGQPLRHDIARRRGRTLTSVRAFHPRRLAIASG